MTRVRDGTRASCDCRSTPLSGGRDPDGYFETVLKPAVQHATERNLYAIVDWHEISDAAPADQETRAFWAKAAPAFASYPNVLFEVFNEAEDLEDSSWTKWKATAQPWVDQIRHDAPSNIILIGAPFWTQAVDGAIADPFVERTSRTWAHLSRYRPFGMGAGWGVHAGRGGAAYDDHRVGAFARRASRPPPAIRAASARR